MAADDPSAVGAGLVDHVVDPADLYDLDVDTLSRLDRLGRTSATKLVDNIRASKEKPLSRVLTGLGVRMTGRSMSGISRISMPWKAAMG